MRYIKTYEQLNRVLEIGDIVVAYRPVNYDKDKNFVTIDYHDYVIDIGTVKDIKEHKLRDYSVDKQAKRISHKIKGKKRFYSIIFRGGNYLRTIEQILYVAKNKEDAEEYIRMLDTTNKYNI